MPQTFFLLIALDVAGVLFYIALCWWPNYFNRNKLISSIVQKLLNAFQIVSAVKLTVNQLKGGSTDTSQIQIGSLASKTSNILLSHVGSVRN